VSHADDVLREAPLFEALSEEDSRALRTGMVDVRLDRGERLFSEGDAGDKLYIILSGKIKLTKAARDGRENLFSVHGPGEMFGELSLFDPIPRTSSATAVTSARLAAIAHDDVRSWLSTRP
jgi:CRP/FNR family transcriptional regulator, cyclic AMP receptor protein